MNKKTKYPITILDIADITFAREVLAGRIGLDLDRLIANCPIAGEVPSRFPGGVVVMYRMPEGFDLSELDDVCLRAHGRVVMEIRRAWWIPRDGGTLPPLTSESQL